MGFRVDNGDRPKEVTRSDRVSTTLPGNPPLALPLANPTTLIEIDASP